MIYAGNDRETIGKIKASLKPGGLFIVEFFTKRFFPNGEIGGFAEGELAEQFREGFTIIRDDVAEDVAEDVADWGPQDKTTLARFVAQKL